MKINRKQILMSILDTIQCISDKNYQKRVWIRAEGPECDDFTETCCNFFGDGDPLLKNHKDFGISNSQYQMLKKFRDVFDDFSGKYHMAQEFIDTPEWENITEMAKDVLKVFHYSKKEDEEDIKKRIINNIISEIKSISDKKYQKRVWVRAEGPEIDDFDETCCRLFDDSAFDFVLENYVKYGITQEQYCVLNKFRDEFFMFSRNNDPSYAFIDTPEWAKIMEMAKDVLKVFHYSKTETE